MLLNSEKYLREIEVGTKLIKPVVFAIQQGALPKHPIQEIAAVVNFIIGFVEGVMNGVEANLLLSLVEDLVHKNFGISYLIVTYDEHSQYVAVTRFSVSA